MQEKTRAPPRGQATHTLTFTVTSMAENASADSTTPPSAESLAESLLALQRRQTATLDALRARNASAAQIDPSVEATFAQLPEYASRLRRVQASMDALAARTASMRERAQRVADVRSGSGKGSVT